MATTGAKSMKAIYEQKEQAFSFTSPASGLGKGERSDPLKQMPTWSPGPGAYNLRSDSPGKESPAFKIPKSKRQEAKIPNYPGPAEGNINLKSTISEGPKFSLGKKLSPPKYEQLGVSPGAYVVKSMQTSLQFSMGSKLDSSLESKNRRLPAHLRPRDTQVPGPGTYDSPSSIRLSKTLKNPTFGLAGREWSDLPKGTPSPNQYSPNKFTETSRRYSIPKAEKSDYAKLYKESFTPGPGQYDLRTDKQEGTAKSILGGPEKKQNNGNGVPGPGQYNPKSLESSPGFRIVLRTSKERDDEYSSDERDEKSNPVGPQRYDPKYPAHISTGVKFGTGTRDDLMPKFFTPAPNNYTIKGDFEKVIEKPQFHLGIKTDLRGNKNLDQPGPGEYNTDIAPMYYTNVAHVIGTSMRSDLGIGKAHLYPGPGEYETRPKIDRPQVGFTQSKKNNQLKKTFEPGPGSYEQNSTVGHIPKYLLIASGQEQTKSQIKKTV